MGYLLGIDLGSSSVKAAIIDEGNCTCIAQSSMPADEMKIDSSLPGFAEQDAEIWYKNAAAAVRKMINESEIDPNDIKGIGIAYQMHGLVCVSKAGEILRAPIIWCDSRAVEYGEKAFNEIGQQKCIKNLLNSPANFTAAKLAWVKKNEPEKFSYIHKIMLPGDWLAFRMTNEIKTTETGLSEGIFWDYIKNEPCKFLLDYFDFEPTLLADTVPCFGIQGELSSKSASDFGLTAGTPVTYRAGDQPNNAFSLNVLNPGEIAATAGTSGVIYAITDKMENNQDAGFNAFLHVNSSPNSPRIGALLCINGCGITYSWLRKILGNITYEEMNLLAEQSVPGSRGLTILPFGNGSERMLGNKYPGGSLDGLDLNRHDRKELCRAVQEGVAFSFCYGMEKMRDVGIELKTIKAGNVNMFLSDTFCKTLAEIGGVEIELYDTDGAIGAARGAGIGIGSFDSFESAFTNLKQICKYNAAKNESNTQEAFSKWKELLTIKLNHL